MFVKSNLNVVVFAYWSIRSKVLSSKRDRHLTCQEIIRRLWNLIFITVLKKKIPSLGLIRVILAHFSIILSVLCSNIPTNSICLHTWNVFGIPEQEIPNQLILFNSRSFDFLRIF
jgi:hypothetical protein